MAAKRTRKKAAEPAVVKDFGEVTLGAVARESDAHTEHDWAAATEQFGDRVQKRCRVCGATEFVTPGRE